MKPQLTEEQQRAIEQHHGLVEVEGPGDGYVLMSMDLYRELMGVGTDEALAESIKAIEEGLADIEAGRTRPYREVLDELGSTTRG